MITIELDLPKPRAYVWLWLLTLALLSLALISMALFNRSDLPIPLLDLAWVALIPALLMLAMRRQRAWIEAGVLHVISTFYHRRIPLSALDIEGAKWLSLHQHPEWRPRLRCNGFALPGMISGWYRLKGWRKAFAAYGDASRVLCMDACKYTLLLGVACPQSTLDKLRRAKESAR